MSPVGLHFGAVAKGSVPAEAAIDRVVVAGKSFPVDGGFQAAGIFGNWVEKGNATPVNALVDLSKGIKGAPSRIFTEIAPGGRPRDEIPEQLLEGKKAYAAKPDMFGPPPA